MGTAQSWIWALSSIGNVLVVHPLLSSWDVFKTELTVNFGPYNSAMDAEHTIKCLSMTDSQKVVVYITKF